MLKRPLDDIFDAFMRDIQNLLEGSWWPHTWKGKLSSLVTEHDIRMPLCDLVYHSFGRRISLPDYIVPSKIEARMENGILRIDLPKKYQQKLKMPMMKSSFFTERFSVLERKYLGVE